MRSLLLVSILSSVPGCLLFFDDGGKNECRLQDVPAGSDSAEVAQAPLRDPETLLCSSFGGDTCDPNCGPCPLSDTRCGAADSQPIPSWGVCGSPCESFSETNCEAAPECRVVRDARCAIAGNCVTEFVGCFPTDTQTDTSVDCFRATDGWSCSRNSACSALHNTNSCTSPVCPIDFGLCVPEGMSPGKCFDQVVCRAAEPACPTNTKAGVANGCYTGACIPLDLCENSI